MEEDMKRRVGNESSSVGAGTRVLSVEGNIVRALRSRHLRIHLEKAHRCGRLVTPQTWQPLGNP